MAEIEGPLSVAVVIPAFRDEGQLDELLESLRRQELPSDFSSIEILVVETDPSAVTEKVCMRHNALHLGIAREDFDHGGTRSWAAKQTSGELVVFLSQDVLFCEVDGLAKLLAPFLFDQSTAACYGRQVAPPDGSETMKMKRSFSYPRQGEKRSTTVESAGHRHVLFSNAFGAYRRKDLEAIGWFGERQLMCEDVAAAATLLACEPRVVRYVADAVVVHRHEESLGRDLARAFDIGASHTSLRTRMRAFPAARGIGVRFLVFGVRQLLQRGVGGFARVPGFVLGCAARWVAYSLGRFHRVLPQALVRRMSLHPLWWSR